LTGDKPARLGNAARDNKPNPAPSLSPHLAPSISQAFLRRYLSDRAKSAHLDKTHFTWHRAQALLHQLRFFASHNLRNVATVGGNVCNASPVSDMLPVMMVLDAVAECVKHDGAGSGLKKLERRGGRRGSRPSSVTVLYVYYSLRVLPLPQWSISQSRLPLLLLLLFSPLPPPPIPFTPDFVIPTPRHAGPGTVVTRHVPLSEWLRGYKRTTLEPGEVLRALRMAFPTAPAVAAAATTTAASDTPSAPGRLEEFAWAHKQTRRKEDDIALVNGAFRVVLEHTVRPGRFF